MPDSTVPSEVRTLAQRLAESKPMRRGSVTERYVKCNKAGCPCRESEDARHGPYYSVSRVVNGRTQSRWLDADQARIVRQQASARLSTWVCSDLRASSRTPPCRRKPGRLTPAELVIII